MVSEIWSDEDLVELHFVRAKEIDALVDQAILPESNATVMNYIMDLPSDIQS